MLIIKEHTNLLRQPTTLDNRQLTTMAATKTIEDFPGAYSGQGRSWERMVLSARTGLHQRRLGT